MIRSKLTSVMVDDQSKALDFYTQILGFALKHDIAMDGARWLTVVTADEPNGTELLLEPMTGSPAAPSFQKALFDAGIPLTAFGVDDLGSEYKRMSALGVKFRGEPSKPRAGPSTAVFEDTCGNLIQLFQI